MIILSDLVPLVCPYCRLRRVRVEWIASYWGHFIVLCVWRYLNGDSVKVDKTCRPLLRAGRVNQRADLRLAFYLSWVVLHEGVLSRLRNGHGVVLYQGGSRSITRARSGSVYGLYLLQHLLPSMLL